MILGSLRIAAAATAAALSLAACGGGGGSSGSGNGGGGTVPVVPTSTPPPPGVSSPYSCPSSATSFGVTSSAGSAATASRAVRTNRALQPDSHLLAVTYDANDAAADRDVQGRAAALGLANLRSLSFDRIGRVVRVVNVGSADPQQVRAKLQSIPGVISVSTLHRRTALTRGATFTNDPYFKGESGTGAPLYETASTGGQWDMHIVGLEHAFSYTMGSTNVRLAIIDTGEDVTHPEIAGATVAYTKCYISSADGRSQSVGNYVTDPDGHGTDVTGIAAAASNNAYGFTGAAGHVGLMLYRVFPTPDDTCSAPQPNANCSASTFDVATAINDAVSNGANVISLSLGDDTSTCNNGTDPDTIEGNAIANALAHNVVVVAAAGNAGRTNVGPPGCDTNVIAVGASAYNDGKPNGSSFTGTRKEYVASYSDTGSPNTANSASSWGIVAPGGDPTGGSDSDSLHWIENIWTSTPFDASFAGACSTDPFGGVGDCRILIAGTSMSTPHVAGAAALVLSVNNAYAAPGSMKQLFCSTADNISDPRQGCGRLNIYRAVAKASGDPNLP